MSEERLRQMKSERLKYANIPWVTVKTTYIEKPARLGRQYSRSAFAPIRSNPVEKPTMHFFNHSHMMFTNDEYSLLLKADSDNTELMTKRLDGRSPSRLQALQQVHDKRIASQIGSNNVASQMRLSRIISNQMMNKNKMFETSDSVISFKPIITEIEEEEDRKVMTGRSEIKENEKPKTILAPATIHDLEEQVWAHSHELNKKDNDKKVEGLNAEFVHDNTGHYQIVKIHSRGERKLKKAIQETSFAEHEIMDLNKSLKGTSLKKGKEQKILKELENSYSAYKYKKYLDKQKLDVPDFFERADFSNIQISRRSVKDMVKTLGWEQYAVSSARKRGRY